MGFNKRRMESERAAAAAKEAEPLARGAFEIFELRLGPDNPNTLSAKRSLDKLMQRNGEKSAQ